MRDQKHFFFFRFPRNNENGVESGNFILIYICFISAKCCRDSCYSIMFYDSRKISKTIIIKLN